MNNVGKDLGVDSGFVQVLDELFHLTDKWQGSAKESPALEEPAIDLPSIHNRGMFRAREEQRWFCRHLHLHGDPGLPRWSSFQALTVAFSLDNP